MDITRGSAVDGYSATGRDRRNTGRREPRCHIQQRLDDVTFEDIVLLPKIKHSDNLALQCKKNRLLQILCVEICVNLIIMGT